MNLHELREAMASDATKENKALKKKLTFLREEYNREVNHLRSCCNAQLKDLEALSNRCYASHLGGLCGFCALETYQCPHTLSVNEQIQMVKELKKQIEANNLLLSTFYEEDKK